MAFSAFLSEFKFGTNPGFLNPALNNLAWWNWKLDLVFSWHYIIDSEFVVPIKLDECVR